MLQAGNDAKHGKALVSLQECYCIGVGADNSYNASVNSFKHSADEHIALVGRGIRDCFYEVLA